MIELLLTAGLLLGVLALAYALKVPNRVDLSNKAVLITGCDSGFGYQLALRAQTAGFVVFAGCLKTVEESNSEETNLEEGAPVLAQKGCHVIKLDVTKQNDINEAVKQVNEVLKACACTLWAVVNNAGKAIHCELEWCSDADLKDIMDVNAFSQFRIAKAFLPALRQSSTSGARVINVASAAAYFTFPGLTAYSMSKHASRSLSDGMRREWKKFYIHVSCIEPTLYRTRICSSGYLIKKMTENWSTLDDEIKSVYGSRYVEDYGAKITKEYKTRPRIQVWEVIDDMMDALTNVKPQFHYHPGFLPKLRLSLFKALPETVVDMILCKEEQLKSH